METTVKKSTSNNSKGNVSNFKRRVMALFLLMLFNIQIFAGVVPDPVTIGTRATKTASGIDQVDIARPNAKGTSYNAFEEFDVKEDGLILNNNIYIVVNTKLAGLVARNRNLDGGVEANLIINDVTGKNRTAINGYVEVAGRKADIVIANRNGIAVNGGGFINVGRATLTTGSIGMKDGKLDTIDVEKGNVSIGNKGIDITSVDFFDIIGKTVNIEGIIKGGDNTKVLISVGGQVYKYATKQVVSKGQTYEGIAIDGKDMGSMYAGKINVISNDKGAGVNLKGNMTSLDDLEITGNGQIATKGKVQSTKKVVYKTPKNIKVENQVFAGEKGIFSGDVVELSATLVTGYLNEAKKGIESLEVSGNKIINTGEIQSFGIAKLNGNRLENIGKIYNDENLKISGGDIKNSGEIYGLNLEITGNSLDNSNIVQSESIYLSINEIYNSGNIYIENDISNSGKILHNTGNIVSNKNINFAIDEIKNTEGLIARNNINIKSKDFKNINGDIIAEKDMNISSNTLKNQNGNMVANNIKILSEKLENLEGSIYTDGRLEIVTNALANIDGEIISSDKMIIDTDILDNTRGFIYGKLEKLSGTTVINEEGSIITSEVLKLVTKNIYNIKGEIYAEGGLDFDSDILDNTEGIITTAGNINIEVDNTINKKGILAGIYINVVGEIFDNEEGVIDSSSFVTKLDMIFINNKGLLISKDEIDIKTDRLENIEGEILTDGKLVLNTDVLDNTKGQIIGELENLGGSILINDEGAIFTNEALNIETLAISNISGEIYAEKRIDIAGNTLDNTEGYIHTEGGIELTVDDIINKSGYILANGLTKEEVFDEVEGNEDIEVVELENIEVENVDTEENREEVIYEGIKIAGKTLDNTDGKIKTLGDLSLDLADSIDNTKGELLGVKSLDIKTGLLINTNGSLLTYGKLVLDTEDLDNTKGKIIGRLEKLSGTNFINDEGILVSTESLEITTKNVSNIKGEIHSDKRLSFDGDRLDNTGGYIHTYGGIDANVGEIINNTGYILANGISKEDVNLEEENEENTEIAVDENTKEPDDDEKVIYEGINIAGNTLDNTDGKIKSLGDINVVVKDTTGNRGTIIGDNVVISGDNFSNEEGLIQSFSFNADLADTFNNKMGLLIAENNIDIESKNIYNQDGLILTNGELVLNTSNILDSTRGEIRGQLEQLGGNKLINNEGLIITNKNLSLNSKNTENISGEIYSFGQITANGDNLNNNKGYIHTNGKIDMNVQNIDNKEGYILSDGLTKEALVASVNDGDVASNEVSEESDDDSSGEDDGEGEEELENIVYGGIAIVGQSLDNTLGVIRGLGDIDIKSNTTNESGILIGANVNIKGNLYGNNGEIRGNDVTIAGSTINNAKGILIAGNNATLTGNVNNDGVRIESANVEIIGTKISNNSGNILGQDINIKSGNIINNSGYITTNNLNIVGNITGNVKGEIIANEFTLNGNLNNNNGYVKAGILDINGMSVTNAYGKIESLGSLKALVQNFNNDYGYIQSEAIEQITNLSNVYGKIYSNSYIGIKNSGNLNNNYGIISSKGKESGIEINAGGTLLNDGGSIKAEGAVIVETGGDLVLDARIEGKVATSLTGNKVYVNNNTYRAGHVELTGRNGLLINGTIDAKTLSLNTNVGLSINYTLNGREGLYIEANTIENNSIVTSGIIVSLNAKSKIVNNNLITSSKDIVLNGGDIYNQNGSKITANNDVIILGNNLYNITTATRNGNNVTVGNGSQITGNNDVIIKISGNLINGFYNVGGEIVRADGTIKDNRVVTGGNYGLIAGKKNTQIEAKNIENRGNIGLADVGETYIHTLGQVRNERTGTYGNGNILGATIAIEANGGLINIGATIKGKNATYISSTNGDIINQSTVKDGIIIFQHDETKSVGSAYVNESVAEYNRSLSELLSEYGFMSKSKKSTEVAAPKPTIDYNGKKIIIPDKIQELYDKKKAEGKKVEIVVKYVRGSSGGGGENGGGETEGYYTFNVMEAYTVVDLKGEGINNIGSIKSDGAVILEANNINNTGGLIAGIGGTLLEAKNDINDKSISVNYSGSNVYVAASSVFNKNKTWDKVSGSYNISGQIGAGGNTQLSAGRDINLINSEITASENVILYADRYLNSLAVNDTEYRYDKEEYKTGHWYNRKKVKEVWEIDNKYANGTTISAGGHILINYGLTKADEKERELKNKGIFLQGTDMYANGSIIAKSNGNIYTEGTKDNLYNYYKKEKHSTGISSVFGGSSSDKKQSTSENYNLTNFYGNTGFTMDSNDRLRIEGADIYSNGNVYLRGKNGVDILPGMASSYYLEVHKKKGWSTSFSVGAGGVSAGVGYGKSSSKYEETRLEVIKSKIYAGGNYVVVSENGNYNQISTDIKVEKDASITAKEINILDRQSTVSIKQESKSSYAGIGVTIGIPVVSSATSLVTSAKALGSANGIGYISAAGAMGQSVMGGISSFNSLMSTMNPFSASISLNFSSSKSKYASNGSYSVGSSLDVGGNLILNGDNLHLRGSNIDVGGNLDYKIKNDILIEAGRSTFTENGKSSGFSIGISKGMMNNKGMITPLADNNKTVNLGYNSNNNWGNGTNRNNSSVNVGGNTYYDVGGDFTIRGGIISTGSISGTIGGNTIIESLQDTYKGGSSGYSFNVGIGIGKHIVKDGTGNLAEAKGSYINSLGGGFNVGKIENKITVDPTTFRAGAGAFDAGQKLTQIGSLIDGNFILNAGSYVYRNLVDVNKSYNFGANITINPNVFYTKTDTNGNIIDAKIGKTIGSIFQIGYQNLSRNILATIGSGVQTNFDIDGVNTDVSKMIEDWAGTKIETISINLGTEYWLTEAGREISKSEISKAKDSIIEILKTLREKMKDEEENDSVEFYSIKLSKEEKEKIKADKKAAKKVEKEEAKKIAKEEADAAKNPVITDLIDFISTKHVKNYETLKNDLNKLLKEGKFDEALLKIVGDQGIVDLIKAKGVSELLNTLTDNKQRTEFYNAIWNYDNVAVYGDANEKMSQFININITVSNELKKVIKKAEDDVIGNLIKTEFEVKIKEGESVKITIKDFLLDNNLFRELPNAQKQDFMKQLVKNIETTIITNINKYVEGTNIKELNDALLAKENGIGVNFSATMSAGAIYRRAGNNATVTLTDMSKELGFLPIKELKELLNDPKGVSNKYIQNIGNNTFYDRLVLLSQIFHEVGPGHYMADLLLPKFNGITIGNSIDIDRIMLDKSVPTNTVTNNKYFGSDKDIFYFASYGERLAYWTQESTTSKLLKKLQINRTLGKSKDMIIKI
ncbi:MAG: hemagglutinin repeat-containing protein [Fusobacteriaceae bacterium]|nr:hemagglutinin repeat-containing protein [Fusobacteriaceae bacterium]